MMDTTGCCVDLENTIYLMCNDEHRIGIKY